MRELAVAGVVFAAALMTPTFATADDTADRTQAISLCRAEVLAQAGADAKVQFDQVRVRPKLVLVDLDVWRDGALKNVRCDVKRGQELTIASITPALQAVAQVR